MDILSDQRLEEALTFASKLADLRMVLGGRNRLLVSRTVAAASAQVLPANGNRVQVAIGIDLSGGIPTTAAACTLLFKDAGGNITFQTSIFAKVADVAAVTPSPFLYNPTILSLLDIGPAIQGSVSLTVSNLTLSTISCLEVVMAGQASHGNRGPGVNVPPSA